MSGRRKGLGLCQTDAHALLVQPNKGINLNLVLVRTLGSIAGSLFRISPEVFKHVTIVVHRMSLETIRVS